MKVQEYNNEFLPKIDLAYLFIKHIESALEKSDDYKGAMQQLKCLGYSEELVKTITTALDFYQEETKKKLVYLKGDDIDAT